MKSRSNWHMALMVVSVVASIAFFFDFGRRWLMGYRHGHQHTAI